MKAYFFTALLCLGCQSWGQFYEAEAKPITSGQTCSAPGPFNQVTTIAGTTSGFSGDNGPATSAQLQSPANALALNGEIYITDTFNSRIRKINGGGVITTLVGTGAANCTTPTTVNWPRGLVQSGADIVFTENGNMVRRYPISGGTITDIAGSCGVPGWTDAVGPAAEFQTPEQIARDGVGNFYVADSDNNKIRKITTANAVTTLCGSGTAGYAEGTCATAQFNTPFGVAVDSVGNVIVADTVNCRIRKITPAGTVSTLAGSGCGSSLDGSLTTARIPNPGYLALDGCDTIYVTESMAGRIRRISVSENSVTTIAGNGTTGTAIDGAAFAARFSGGVWGITVDGSWLLVADTDNHRIRSIGP